MFTKCLMCGSKDVEQRKEDRASVFQGEKFIVPDVEYTHCNTCGEDIFDIRMQEKIESFRPVKEKV